MESLEGRLQLVEKLSPSRPLPMPSPAVLLLDPRLSEAKMYVSSLKHVLPNSFIDAL